MVGREYGEIDGESFFLYEMNNKICKIPGTKVLS